MPSHYDYLIVGAGFAGCVLAERLATQAGKRCLLIDRRHHIGGNAHDACNSTGVLVHQYGPHYFRTNSERIKNYLGKFTDWHHVEYKILVWTEGRYWQFPINLNTFEQLQGHPATTEEMEAALAHWRVPIETPQNSEEIITSQVGRVIYEKFYKNYTRKQWGYDPKELLPSVSGRIPIRTNRDDRYVGDAFQALPKDGYHRMFERMVAHPNIEIRLRTDHRTVAHQVSYGHLIYTGRIDEYYESCFGPLPYRSLRFEHENFDREYVQPVVQVNYPNNFDFTRIVEIKHATGQVIPVTTIVREYPRSFHTGSEPYYPIPIASNQNLYQKYAQRAALETKVSFVGRLATYRYYNMDQIVGMALTEWERLRTGNEAREIFG